MTEPVSLSAVKAHVSIGAGFTADDGLLTGLITAARRRVELATRRQFGGDSPTLTGDDAALAGQAILLIIGAWYANREAATMDAKSAPAELPLSATWILDGLRRWDDGA